MPGWDDLGSEDALLLVESGGEINLITHLPLKRSDTANVASYI
jgi:hypothetical protein